MEGTPEAPSLPFRSPLDHVLRFAPMLVPIVAVALAVQHATREGYVFLAGFLGALLVSQTLVRIVKKALKQPRPPGHTERCGTIWEPLNSSRKPGYGMPSGHSAVAALMLTFGVLILFDQTALLSKGYTGSNMNRYATLLIGGGLVTLYSLGVVFHRMVIRCHSPPQVLVGMLIGATAGTAGYFASKAALA